MASPLTHTCSRGLHGKPLQVKARFTIPRPQRSTILTRSLFGKKSAKTEQKEEKKDWRGSVLSALDFAETRSEDDARLLTTARGRKKGDRMSADEAKALRRKVGGTASNYFKEWVDVKGAYADKGYVSKAELPTALPFLLLVVLGLVGAIGFVVTQTSAPPSPSASAAAEQRATLSREQREEYGLR